MLFSKTSVLVAVATLFAVNVQANEATYYLPSGAYGACGIINQNSDLVAALSPSEYASGANCFRHMSVEYQGRTVDVEIVDLCPSCAAGHIDLSEGAFEQLADLGVGVINGVTYNYI